MISSRPRFIQIEPRLLRPLVTSESEGRISQLGAAHRVIAREMEKARLERYPQTPVAFDPRKKQVFGAYDINYPRYGFTVKASDIVQTPHLKGRFSLDF